ncbi:MAG: hypothetical protein NT167_21815 [Verrucomicrobia bacterium]|nr:hypothetical protein [Verrucomicrobiota bacterium]
MAALFYAVEDWRGRQAWQSYKHAWEAKGERFDLASLAPPPVPNDQNFFETPLWAGMHFVATNRSTVWSDTNWGNRVIFTINGPKDTRAPSPGSWLKAQRVDLLAWQEYYRGSNNLFAARSGPATNYFPIAKEPQTPASDVLLALSRFVTNRQLLITASACPESRFWANYDAGFACLLPHLARLKMSSQYLSLHANAALKAGDRETALEDIKLLFRLIESIRGEPIVISQCVRIAMLSGALQPVWEGLADRQWTEAELNAIGSTLGTLDFLADYHHAVRGERAFNLWGLDYIRKMGIAGLQEMGFERQDSESPEQLLTRVTFPLIPSGWFDQDKLYLCRMYEKHLLPLVMLQERRVVSHDAIQEADSALVPPGGSPYYGFSSLLLPSLGGFAEKSARAQSSIDLARVACALERYRLANGQFPDTLDALAPKFIAKLPHDVINGQPLKYRRTDDGQFVLYSVGLNETDDGGTIVLTKYGNLDENKSDWVWRYH